MLLGFSAEDVIPRSRSNAFRVLFWSKGFTSRAGERFVGVPVPVRFLGIDLKILGMIMRRFFFGGAAFAGASGLRFCARVACALAAGRFSF